MSPATSKCTWWPPGLASKAVFRMMSGCRLGALVLFTACELLLLPLLVSNWPPYAPVAEKALFPRGYPGRTTEPGRVCCGFSNAKPIAQLFVGRARNRIPVWRAQVKPNGDVVATS